jgi:hypothetical protein
MAVVPCSSRCHLDGGDSPDPLLRSFQRWPVGPLGTLGVPLDGSADEGLRIITKIRSYLDTWEVFLRDRQQLGEHLVTAHHAGSSCLEADPASLNRQHWDAHGSDLASFLAPTRSRDDDKRPDIRLEGVVAVGCRSRRRSAPTPSTCDAPQPKQLARGVDLSMARLGGTPRMLPDQPVVTVDPEVERLAHVMVDGLIERLAAEPAVPATSLLDNLAEQLQQAANLRRLNVRRRLPGLASATSSPATPRRAAPRTTSGGHPPPPGPG